MKIIDDFFLANKFDGKKKIIVSIDLDNTLVIRDKGSNYINPKISKILKLLITKGKVILVPNTGREFVGFSAFRRMFPDIKDGILGSGSFIINGDHSLFNKRSRINLSILKAFILAVKKNHLPFVDFSYDKGRIVYFGSYGAQYKNLFFSQNPSDWFDNKFPPRRRVDNFDAKILSRVYRVEFPVIHSDPKHKKLFASLTRGSTNNTKYLPKILEVKNKKVFMGYNLQRKLYFNDYYSDRDVLFARFGRNFDFVNKGIGLKIWLKNFGFSSRKFIVIHIGDKDSGLINDTLIKKDVPSALVIMVGEKCEANNPVVDLYLRGDTEKLLLDFFQSLYKNLIYTK